MTLQNDRNSEYWDLNNYCAIREYWNLESQKAFLAFGSLVHRSKHAWWNVPSIVKDKFNWKFVWFDYPKKNYKKDEVIKQIVEYIEKSNCSVIILCWVSFGEIVISDILKELSPVALQKIKLHISICWVSWMEDLTLPKHAKVVKYAWFQLLRTLVWTVGKLDRWKLLRYFISKWLVDQNSTQPKNKLHNHKRAASLWINPWLWDRFLRLVSQTNADNESLKRLPWIALYSTNDPMFKNPKKSSENIVNNSKNDPLSQTIEVQNWWHAALVEMPEVRDEKTIQALSTVWANNEALSN